MGIGVFNRKGFQGEPIQSFIARNQPQVYTSVPTAQAAGNVVNQGGKQAVIPAADSTTNTVAPPVPGGLQMEKVLLVTPTAPIPGKVLP